MDEIAKKPRRLYEFVLEIIEINYKCMKIKDLCTH